MSGNTFGQLFRVTTYGESHGTALGCIIDGCPPQLELSAEDIQIRLKRKKPRKCYITTQRIDGDKVEMEIEGLGILNNVIRFVKSD